MRSGSFGSVVFCVSFAEVLTFGSYSRSRSITFGEHSVISGKPRLQHAGRALDTLELPIVVDSFIPFFYPCRKRMEQFMEMAESGEALPLVLGNSYKGLFVLTAVRCDAKVAHGDSIQRMNLTLSLKEYN